MRKKSLNSRGFGLIGVLIVIAVLVVAGGAGAYVYHRDHKAKSAASANSSTQTQTTTTTTPSQSVDPTAGWVAYTSTSGKFSLKYPKAWVTAANLSQCSDGIFMLGADNKSVGTCGSNNFGQMTVTWQPVRTSCGLTSTYWTTNSTQAVMVSGINGTETTGTAKAGGSVPEGTTTVQYCLTKNGTMYVADYTQLSTYPDVVSDFNTMITKSLTFN
jgi:uncharacterized membrane protein